MARNQEDCEDWARREIRNSKFTSKGSPKLIKITPPSGPGIEFLGSVRMPDGMETPRWAYHYAISMHGNMYDIDYPNGMSESDFKSRFEYGNDLNFEVVSH